MKIAYFVHNIHDAAVLKRISLIESADASVVLIGFTRFESATTATETDPTIVLGKTYDGKFLLRILSVFACMFWPSKLIDALKQCDVILCRNLEMLALGYVIKTMSGSRAPLNYEALDIHKKMLGSGATARLLRTVERFLLRRCHCLLTSSPGFLDNYFYKIQHYDGQVAVVENKVMPQSQATAPAARKIDTATPWVIGWFGIIRCQKSLRQLQSIVRAAPDVRVIISGRIAVQEFDDFEAQLRETPQITYTGPYTSDQLAGIYGQSHFVWAIDYFEEGENSEWLLPNRLYDSLAFGAIPIALGHVQTGHWLNARAAGLVVKEPVKELTAFLATMTPEDYQNERARLKAVPQRDIFHSAQSGFELVKALH